MKGVSEMKRKFIGLAVSRCVVFLPNDEGGSDGRAILPATSKVRSHRAGSVVRFFENFAHLMFVAWLGVISGHESSDPW